MRCDARDVGSAESHRTQQRQDPNDHGRPIVTQMVYIGLHGHDSNASIDSVYEGGPHNPQRGATPNGPRLSFGRAPVRAQAVCQSGGNHAAEAEEIKEVDEGLHFHRVRST